MQEEVEPSEAVKKFRYYARVELAEVAFALLSVCKAYEAWEADLVLNNSWDGKDGLPTLTQAQYDRMLEIQLMRNAAIKKASK